MERNDSRFVHVVASVYIYPNLHPLTTQYPVELINIRHHYTTVPILSDVSLAFAPEGITAILGKSGSGKSTLLQIINGMIRPDQGEVKIFGKPIDYGNIQAMRLQIGYVVQQVGLFPHLTIYENIALLGKIAHRPTDVIRKRVEQLMDMVQLPLLHLDKYPYQLSGGEQQRAGLCRAMLLEPPVLLMDEPFASLDYETKHSIYDHLIDIQKSEPRIILLVSHDWEEAQILADRFVLLEHGQIKTTGDKATIEQTKYNYTSRK
jgi:osmoprotectant transport system ATP-binding protein